MQAQARQEAGLKAGEGWFDVCSEGSRAAGARSSPTQRHSEYSACLGEAMYSATAQALSFLCAVAPQASSHSLNKSQTISVSVSQGYLQRAAKLTRSLLLTIVTCWPEAHSACLLTLCAGESLNLMPGVSLLVLSDSHAGALHCNSRPCVKIGGALVMV